MEIEFFSVVNLSFPDINEVFVWSSRLSCGKG